MQPLFLFFLLYLLLSCNSSANRTSEKTAGDSAVATDVLISDSATTGAKDTVPLNIQVDSVIHLAFEPGTNAIQVEGHLDRKGEPVICLLPVVEGKKLTASVNAKNEKATIRFSQIYLPDGKSDGPFGQTLNYKLPQKGLYKLLISPNKMAGDPASTDFVLKVKVE